MSDKVTNIVGVDFSGSKNKNTTAVTTALFRKNILKVTDCYPLGSKLENAHSELRKLLESLPANSVVAMDFPFSIPRDAAVPFLDESLPDSKTMADLWRNATRIGDFEKFEKLPYVKNHAKTMRRGDKKLKNPNPIPPLKRQGNPTLLPMTFHGMRLLHCLREAQPCRFHVPPLCEKERTGPVLLETHPGAALGKLGLRYNGYKGKGKGVGKKRNEILKGLAETLEKNTDLTLNLPVDFRHECLANDDCLDSLVAAVVAALWKKDKSKFRTPSQAQLPDAKLEGWIYVPKQLPTKRLGPAEGPNCRGTFAT